MSWQIWLIISGLCFILEIITVGFLVFWLAIAALIVAFISLFTSSIIVQTSFFVILSTLLIFLTRPFANKITSSDNAKTNSSSIIGKHGIVTKEISKHSSGQVKVEGEVWTAILNEDSSATILKDSIVEIQKIDGVKVIVELLKAPDNT